MKKNNKGFFLAESIIVIALVTTVMAFVYPNVTKLYENYTNKTFYYDQPEDIYRLKYVYDYIRLNHNGSRTTTWLEDFTTETNQNSNNKDIPGCKIFDNGSMFTIVPNYADLTFSTSFSGVASFNIYITGYMTTPTSTDYEFNKYLNRLKKTTYDKSSYRLIGKFNVGTASEPIWRYASIKISNPNPERSCNLGG